MSFAKARIQRFNDLTNKVPPPGTYDPKFGPKVKGLAIEKKEKFQDNISVTSNSTESSLSVSSKSSKHQLPGKFIAPQCVRKRVVVKPMNTNSMKEKLKSGNQTNSKSVNKQQYNSTHQLLELQVECENKNRTIQEHEKQIEEMKGEMCKLEVQIEELHKKQIEVEEQHKKDIETMAKLQQEVLDNHDERHQAEANELRSKFFDMLKEKDEEIKTRKKLENELRKRVAELSEKILHLESEMAKKTEINQIMIQTLETKSEELLSKLKAVEEERNIQIDLLEKEKLQFTLDVNDLTENKCELEVKLEKRQNVILELQGQLSALQCELDELRAEYDKLVDDSMMQKSELIQKHNKEKETSMNWFLKENQKLEQEHEKTKMTVVKLETDLEKVTETNTCLQHELQDMKRLYTDVNQRLMQAHKELEIAEEKHERLLKVHKTEIEALKKKHSEENLEIIQLLGETRENFLNELESISTMIKEATSEIEEEMCLNDEKCKERLARIESERVALEDKLALKDAEIEKLSSIIEELKLSTEIQNNFSISLQIELDRVETELVDKKAELRALKDQIRSEAAELVSRRKRFEIIMTENKAAFTAVSERLAQSNAEVERLQYELRRSENSLQEHREALFAMYNSSQILQNYTKQLDANREIVNQIEADSISECESMKKHYELKIDEFKQIATKEINLLRETVKKKSSENEEMKIQLDNMASTLCTTRDMLLSLEQVNDEREIEISRLELDNTKLQEQLKKQKNFTEESMELRSKLPTTCSPIVEKPNCHILVQSKKERLEEKDRCADNSVLIEKEKEARAREENLLKNLTAEKILRKNAETELKTLTKSNNLLLKEYEEINETYGHNFKQKIKHIAQLKSTIFGLEQELLSRCTPLEQQQQNVTAEKVKTQQKRSQTKGKENVIGGGVSRSSHTTPTSSPHKSLTPLRDRNE
ncbi:myosin-9-like isoform X2 [Polistes fuscatus]|uniref:myosin-9-like isoform X2 n=1 Tax=Polistes fuscatus TaxID=30207 RepID=UPI001CAA4120|nr:myosin-9-like isoform X2 [Polistes fuscatus]